MIKSVAVGPFDISVESMSAVEATDTNAFGDYSAITKRIRIREDLSDPLQRETFVHELLHAVWDVYHLPGADEEEIVSRLATALLAACRHNPALAEVLFERR